jgi:hypothetical protein
MVNFKNIVKNNVKNIYGWKTKRKIVVFSVDDYGNVRIDSKKAREAMDKAGLKIYSRFDALDTLETRDDLSMLYETLSSVKDKNGKNAIFTPFSLPCNIDFESMESNNFSEFKNELLPVTFQKLASLQPNAYNGTWNLWKEGIDKGLMVPQFHGREHLNLKILKDKLASKSKDVLGALKNRSYTSIDDSEYPTMNFTAAFDFFKFEENLEYEQIITDGLNCFEEVFGYRAVHFNSPGGGEHPIIHKYLFKNGIKYMDAEFLKSEHQGGHQYKRILNFTGKRNTLNMFYEVRNVVFEPTEEKGIDWVNFSMKQIETAFFWNRPAIISSHRVNFCGHIDENNRKTGILALRTLLHSIVKKWPDVEFMSADELGNLVQINN